MSIKADHWIRKMAKEHKMIDPFVDAIKRNGKVSYGLSSYGYDLRVATEFKIFTNVHSAVVDPKKFDERSFVDVKGVNSVLIPPNSFALTRSIEYLKIPRSVLGLCIGKSTYARCGIIVNVTPLQPEFEGYIVIEISNTTPLPAKVYAHEGIAEIVFFEADEECEKSYKDLLGKYSNQKTIGLPKV
ncbi:dCTP deaminase [Candidatus Roizmanbacteria bacterium RIFCSPLOWO2_01_FULL_38_12]|uniref:dCTP deaminase n=1 Tax=Candidatus Roizmanbacteria bacterium RIFCSPLOWO2_01_FULL_38_12 TaxID=1802061 RepID=A0A1F7IV75_9BACT|nr:MAG: dCTP deaminase [Candidatus Roizmanbacteria bacterium RIFCSPHIGHO2_12_FULL_38_13]OGK47256.1 MAG: dCTP deaminase [Candidatus Roizmanbacteria bacterium RIFCSPLOWO2_01_FULL_38_12]